LNRSYTERPEAPPCRRWRGRNESCVALLAGSLFGYQGLQGSLPARTERWNPQGALQLFAGVARQVEQRVGFRYRDLFRPFCNLDDFVSRADFSFAKCTSILEKALSISRISPGGSWKLTAPKFSFG